MLNRGLTPPPALSLKRHQVNNSPFICRNPNACLFYTLWTKRPCSCEFRVIGGYICHALYCQDVIGQSFLDAFDPHQTTKQLARWNTYGPPVTLLTMISSGYSALRNERDRPASFGGVAATTACQVQTPLTLHTTTLIPLLLASAVTSTASFHYPPGYVLRSTSLRSSSTATTSRGMKFDDSLAECRPRAAAKLREHQILSEYVQ